MNSGCPDLKISIAKETADYRIDTTDPENWFMVANRDIPEEGVIIANQDMTLIDVEGFDYVDVVLKETGEVRRVFKSISAVPGDYSCLPTVLELPWCFMNHSCDPNAVDKWGNGASEELNDATTYAVRKISKGDPLTYDYANEQYEYQSPFWCQCGATNCRGKIEGFSGLEEAEKERILKSASPFVARKHSLDLVNSVDLPTVGNHLLVDYWKCDLELLNDEQSLRNLLMQAAEGAGANVLSVHSHSFPGEGVTAVAILSESHLSIHTWPKLGYVSADFYTCGTSDPRDAHKILEAGIGAGKARVKNVVRGKESQDASGYQTNIPGLSEDKSWFFEGAIPGCREGKISHGFLIDKVVLEERSKFQDYLIFDSLLFGRVLVLDGVVQLSTSDEYIYHEMLVHPPMLAHQAPKRVLIVGGGDGGTLREVLKHNPEKVVMIDIDEQFVINIRGHLPTLHDGAFSDPRVELIFEDAFTAISRFEGKFDVAIIDCNDDLGPSEPLFTEEFYAMVSRSLSDEGVTSVQVGSLLDEELITRTKERMEGGQLGEVTGFHMTIPIYHCGQYCFLSAAKTGAPSGPDIPSLHKLQEERSLKTRYWSPEVHHASQVLPPKVNLW